MQSPRLKARELSWTQLFEKNLTVPYAFPLGLVILVWKNPMLVLEKVAKFKQSLATIFYTTVS